MAYSTRQTRGIYCIETIWYGDASPPSGSHWGDLPPVGDALALVATLRGREANGGGTSGARCRLL